MFGLNGKKQKPPAKHKLTVPVRRVRKFVRGYAVMEFKNDGWHRVSNFYNHSTSAYAALGRMVHNATS